MRVRNVSCSDTELIITLDNQSRLSVSLNRFPRLQQASIVERSVWHLFDDGMSIRWEDIDEDISVRLLLGQSENRSETLGEFKVERSAQPAWCAKLPIQQQSVLLLASRGPDGVSKKHPCKKVHAAYRACVYMAGKYGRMLRWGEKGDGFMTLDIFAHPGQWSEAVYDFIDHIDELPIHYVTHLHSGAEILAYKHPNEKFRERWTLFYKEIARSLHLSIETEAQMDARLADWGRNYWDELDCD